MKRYALVPDRIWNGVSDEVEADTSVIVDGEKIEAIIATNELPPDIERLFLDGCTLIPGLIDAHVHYCASMGSAYLAAGVTTVRDTGCDLDWILDQREKLAKDPKLGPTIVCCGFALDGPKGLWHHVCRPHADAEAIRESVREHVDRGVDAIKLYAFLSPEMYLAGSEEAHRLGMFVLAYNESVPAEDILEMGIDETEHQSGYRVAWRAATEEEDDALIDRFMQHNHVMDPTLVVWDRIGRVFDQSIFQDGRRKWVHPEYLMLWDRFPYRSQEPERRLRFQRAIPNLKRFLRRAHERGVTVAIGTDAPFLHLVPGFSLHDELLMYVDAGIRPVDALRSATSINAKVLGIDSKVGRTQAGFDADLTAIKGNPLDRMDDIGGIVLTVHKGAVLYPKELLETTLFSFDRPLDDPIVRDAREYVDRSAVINREGGDG
jgi:hypothetical protein